jgi:hypothetical protein
MFKLYQLQMLLCDKYETNFKLAININNSNEFLKANMFENAIIGLNQIFMAMNKVSS